ncbi:MAG: hypothetical protein ACIAXF_17710 [Phycisphaerales bacterium JB063]
MTWASTPHTQAYDGKVQDQIDAHLDKIEKVLARDGATRTERRAITDELETQIRDMLVAEAKGEPMTPAHLAAVLGRLDPPEAYRKPAPGLGHPVLDKVADRAWPMNAAWPLGFCIAGWVIVLVSVVLSGGANTGGAIVFNLVGLAFGYIYRKQELGRQGLVACAISVFILLFAG